MPASTFRFPPGFCLAAAATALLLGSPAYALQTNSPRIANFDEVAPNIYRGASPKDEDIASLKKLGVTTILDLRMRHSRAEETVARAQGMQWIHLPMGYLAPSDKVVRQAMKVLANAGRRAVFIHCRQGADRTGTIIALYRVLIQDWSFANAYREMRAHHFNPLWFALKEKVETAREHLDQGTQLSYFEEPTSTVVLQQPHDVISLSKQ